MPRPMSTAVEKQNGRSSATPDGPAGGGSRIVAPPGSLDELVGAHPDALRKMYRNGRPADPAELGDHPRGRILAIEAAGDLFLMIRPIVRALATDAFPWKGKVFDHGGNAGQNVVLGKPMLRFRTELGPSEVDGKPTLVLLYDSDAFKNPWPVRAIRDELRSIGPRIAIGPAYITLPSGGRRCLLWFGLAGT